MSFGSPLYLLALLVVPAGGGALRRAPPAPVARRRPVRVAPAPTERRRPRAGTPAPRAAGDPPHRAHRAARGAREAEGGDIGAPPGRHDHDRHRHLAVDGGGRCPAQPHGGCEGGHPGIPGRGAGLLPRRRRLVRERRARRGTADSRSRARRRGARRAPHRRGHGARRRDREGRRGRAGRRRRAAATNEEPTPTTVLVVSDGKEDGGSSRPRRRASWHASAACPSSAVGMGTPDGVVEVPLAGGYTARVEVPADPDDLARRGRRDRGQILLLADARAAAGRVRELESRLGREEEWREVTVAFAAAGAIMLLLGGALSASWFRRLP